MEEALGGARGDTWETGRCERCARSWPAVAAEMEEGGRDKAPLQSQQPPATSPGGADEKPGGKERRDAGDKDKEQELVRCGPGSRRRRPQAESLKPRRPRARLPTALRRSGEDALGRPLVPPKPRFSAPHPPIRPVTSATPTSPHHRLVRWAWARNCHPTF